MPRCCTCGPATTRPPHPEDPTDPLAEASTGPSSINAWRCPAPNCSTPSVAPSTGTTRLLRRLESLVVVEKRRVGPEEGGDPDGGRSVWGRGRNGCGRPPRGSRSFPQSFLDLLVYARGFSRCPPPCCRPPVRPFCLTLFGCTHTPSGTTMRNAATFPHIRHSPWKTAVLVLVDSSLLPSLHASVLPRRTSRSLVISLCSQTRWPS